MNYGKERLCAECGEQIRQIDGLWRHVKSNRVCKDGLSQRRVIKRTDRKAANSCLARFSNGQSGTPMSNTASGASAAPS